MIDKPLSPCGTCPFWSVTHKTPRKPWFETFTGTGFCEPEGLPLLGVAFVAEASGSHEEEEGLPLRPYAQAGSIHTRVLRAVYASRRQTMAFNVLACRPPNNELDKKPYESAVIAQCAPIRNARITQFHEFAKQAQGVKQPVIVALGDTAFKVLTGLTGDYRSISYARGYPVMRDDGILVLGTWHPAHVRRHTKLLGVLTHDYRRAFELARDGFSELPRNYVTRPSEAQIRDFRARVLALPLNVIERSLMFDIETPNIDNSRPIGPDNPSHILSVQFSLAPGEAIFIDVNPDTRPLLAEILAQNCAKVGFNNWDFDDEVVGYHGLKLGGKSYDALWMFHHWQPDLVMEDAGADAENDMRFSTAASLQSVASFYGMDFMWKHLRGTDNDEDARFYGCADVDALARIIMLGERGIGPLPKQLKENRLW